MNNKKENVNSEYVSKILKKYPDKVPVIFVPSNGVPVIDKRKFIIPRDILVSQLLFIIRQKIKLEPEKGMYIFFGKNNLVSSNTILSEVYDKYKEKDGVLYATYSSENTFG